MCINGLANISIEYTASTKYAEILKRKRNEKYIGNEDIIKKIIKEYGSEIKRDYNNI